MGDSGRPAVTVATLPPLPGCRDILHLALFCGHFIAVSTEDGISPDRPYILRDGADEWEMLQVN